MRKLQIGDLSGRVGEEIGVSPWLEVSQDRIDLFAKAIDDPQWIHIDPERAKKMSIHPTATVVRTITTSVALAKSPNAMPEFCTW